MGWIQFILSKEAALKWQIMGLFWDHLGLFWDYFGTIWDYFGTILEPFWCHFGTILGSFLIILRPFWDYFGTIFSYRQSKLDVKFWTHTRRNTEDTHTHTQAHCTIV